MYESWKKGNKVVLAVRKERDENPVKKFFAHMYYVIIHKFVQERMPVGGCDCYLIDRQVIEVLERLDEFLLCTDPVYVRCGCCVLYYCASYDD